MHSTTLTLRRNSWTPSLWQDLVDAVEGAFKAISKSTLHERFHSRLKGHVMGEDYYYDNGVHAARVMYYKSGAPMYVGVADRNGVARWIVGLEEDNSIFELKFYDDTGKETLLFSDQY